MSDDVLITPASRKVEFFDSAGNIDGKIELDSNGDLNITSTGSIAIGDITQDIHVGDGTQAVDLVFDFASSIYSVANQDLTIGKKSLGGNDILIESPSPVRVSTASGYIDVGPANTGYAHIQTDRTRFYLNKPLIIDGGNTNGDAYLVSSYTTEDFVIATNNGAEDRITVKQATGNVGIATTSPAAKLHVEQDDGAVHGLKVYRNDSSTSTSLAYFHDDSVYVDNPTLHVKNDRADQYGYAAVFEGKVGIGTVAPDQQLHVEGSILADAYNFATTTLASNYTDGQTSLVLTDASQFPLKGSGTINGVAFTWTSISGNTLTVPDLDANYTSGVTVVADTGLFFRDGFENVAQPSVTIYDKDNSGVSRDDLSINANSGIRFRLGNESQMQLTADKLSLTTGNQGAAAIFGFRDRTDMGLKSNASYAVGIMAPDSVYVNIDSNNNDTIRAFIVAKDSSTVGSGTEVFRVQEDGKVGIGEDDPGSLLEIRGATTIGTTTGHVMLTGDSATNGQGPQIVFSESGSGSSFAGAYIGHVRTGSNSMGDLVFATRQSSGDANTVPTEVMRLKGGTSPEITTAANITSTSANNYNLYWPLYFQRDNLGTSNIDMRLPVGGAGTSSPNNFAMPRAGKVMAFTVHYYGGTVSTSGSDTDTWRIRRLHSGGTEVTKDTVVAMDTLVPSANANNRNVTVELSTPMDFNANDSIAFKRTANSGHSIHEVNAVLWIHFDA